MPYEPTPAYPPASRIIPPGVPPGGALPREKRLQRVQATASAVAEPRCSG